MTETWILHINIIEPDFKRPQVHSIIETFRSKKNAVQRLKCYQKQYIQIWELDDDTFDTYQSDKFSKWCNEFFNEECNYMVNLPFDYHIWKSEYNDDSPEKNLEIFK
jgi:hypothetical protein